MTKLAIPETKPIRVIEIQYQVKVKEGKSIVGSIQNMIHQFGGSPAS